MNYLNIGGDIDKIEMTGNLLPERYAADPEKCAIRGEDICYLAEHWKRFDNADRAAPVLFDFTRRISANQAFTVLSGIETLFRIGAALKSLPAARQVVKNPDSHNSFSGLDLASSDDLEEMTPKPQPGLLVEAAPFLAAFRNIRKLAGFVLITELCNDYQRLSSVFAKAGDPAYSLDGPGNSIVYRNEWASIEEIDGQSADRIGIEAIAAPNSFGDPWRPDGMASGSSLSGMQVLSGSHFSVFASFSNHSGTNLNGSGSVIIFDSGWKDGVASRLGCSPNDARNNILPKLCDAVGVPWAMVGGNYSGISGTAAVRGYVSATVHRIAVCAF
jgi:hypothetical protein